MWADRWTKADVNAWLESLGLSGQLRPEALDGGDYIRLAHALAKRFAGAGSDAGTAGTDAAEDEFDPESEHESESEHEPED